MAACGLTITREELETDTDVGNDVSRGMVLTGNAKYPCDGYLF